jgi:hypothetical protein
MEDSRLIEGGNRTLRHFIGQIAVKPGLDDQDA